MLIIARNTGNEKKTLVSNLWNTYNKMEDIKNVYTR